MHQYGKIEWMEWFFKSVDIKDVELVTLSNKVQHHFKFSMVSRYIFSGLAGANSFNAFLRFWFKDLDIPK